MKALFTILFLSLVSIASFAQGKGKGKYKVKKEKNHTVYAQQTGRKYSKNQPAKVRAAFQRDYPNATNVTWSKYQGDWTATFGNGVFRSTAVYHANGERRDTRTRIYRRNLPGNTTVWDDIFRRNGISADPEIMQIESPSLRDMIYRVATNAGTALFLNATGQPVDYNY